MYNNSVCSTMIFDENKSNITMNKRPNTKENIL